MIRGAFGKLGVVLIRDAHATYDVDDIPSTVVSRVAEHALGDELELATTETITFRAVEGGVSSPNTPSSP
jgi:hypothetical protein